MLTFSILNDESTFTIVLLDEVANLLVLKELATLTDVICVKARFVYSITHLQLAVNRAFSNQKVGAKSKFKTAKLETIYLLSLAKKQDVALKLHAVDEQCPYFLIFLNKSSEEISELVKGTEGKRIEATNWADFVDIDFILKEYEIEEEEIMNVCGVDGAVCNRVALKDLK